MLGAVSGFSLAEGWGTAGGGIMLAEVRFGLDDDPARRSLGSVALQQLSEHVAGYDLGVALVESRGDDASWLHVTSRC